MHMLALRSILPSWKDFMKKKYIFQNLCLAKLVCGDLNCSDNNSSELRIMYLSSMKCVKNNLNSSLEITLVSFGIHETNEENCSLVIKVWYCIAVFDKVKTSAAKGYIRIVKSFAQYTVLTFIFVLYLISRNDKNRLRVCILCYCLKISKSF